MEKVVVCSDVIKRVYKNKRVLVTGHSGFKGSWLCLWLIELGAEVAGFSKYLPSNPCHFEISNLKDKLRHYEGDIRSIEELKSVFDDFKPQIVFHLAAQPIVLRSYAEPKLTFDTNLGGTINTLECIKDTQCVEAAVIITSDKCYENVGWDGGYKETDRLGGQDPYSASKACAEIACSSYMRSFFSEKDSPKIATTRAGNVIGGGDWADNRLIPDCVTAWSKGEVAVIRNPEATRPWQHVLEASSGYLWLGACLLNKPDGIAGEAFNFGPASGVVKPVKDLVDLFLTFWGGGKWRHEPFLTEKREASLLKLSCDRALERLSWKPVLTFEETVALTAHWYKEYYSQRKNMYGYTVSQIAQYIEQADKQQMVWAVAK